MGKLKGIFVLIMIVAVLSLGLPGCKSKSEHPSGDDSKKSSEHPSKKNHAAEHPTEKKTTGSKTNGEHPK